MAVVVAEGEQASSARLSRVGTSVNLLFFDVVVAGNAGKTKVS